MDPGNLKPGINISDVAASFQAAAIDMLVDKTIKAAHAAYEAKPAPVLIETQRDRRVSLNILKP